MPTTEEVSENLKTFILEEFLPDEDPEDLTYDLELITTGILDSVSVISVVAHMEETYDVQVEAHEASVDNMNTIESMASLVVGK